MSHPGSIASGHVLKTFWIISTKFRAIGALIMLPGLGYGRYSIAGGVRHCDPRANWTTHRQVKMFRNMYGKGSLLSILTEIDSYAATLSSQGRLHQVECAIEAIKVPQL